MRRAKSKPAIGRLKKAKRRVAKQQRTASAQASRKKPVKRAVSKRGDEAGGRQARGVPDQAVSELRVFFAGGVRTPIGNFGGALANSSAAELGGLAARAALDRAGVAGGAVDEVIVGHARQAGNGPNLARQVVRRAGLATRPACTIGKLRLRAARRERRECAARRQPRSAAGGTERDEHPFPRWTRWGKPTTSGCSTRCIDGSVPLCNQLMGETARRSRKPNHARSRMPALASNQRRARVERGPLRARVPVTWQGQARGAVEKDGTSAQTLRSPRWVNCGPCSARTARSRRRTSAIARRGARLSFSEEAARTATPRAARRRRQRGRGSRAHGHRPGTGGAPAARAPQSRRPDRRIN